MFQLCMGAYRASALRYIYCEKLLMFINYFVSYEVLHIYLFCNNWLCCRPLHRSVILGSGSILRSRSQISDF
jgi:hypothetical protein